MKKNQMRNAVVQMAFKKEISLITRSVKSKRKNVDPKHKGPNGLYQEFGV